MNTRFLRILKPFFKLVYGESRNIKGRFFNLKKETIKHFAVAVLFFASFIIWTILVRVIDVEAIGPQGSSVGFATVNGYFHELIGVNMNLYLITDWLSLIPACFIIAFGSLGLMQWIKRKNILKVDFDILILGAFYIIVMAIYLMFESMIINFRPVLINGILEASYPSSTTLLVLCVMPTAMIQLNNRIKNTKLKKCAKLLIIAFIVFMVTARLLSGVHWLSDIIGGIFISTGLVSMYYFLYKIKKDL